jgi:hypothetical protein
LIVWRIRPLPDFLSDHTLPGSSPAERLRDVIAKWIQWIGNLWSWNDRATFAIRFLAQNGGVEVFLLASAHSPDDEDGLRGEIEVLLRAHRLCLNDPLGQKALMRCIESWSFDGDAILEVRQTEVSTLWQPRASLLSADQFRHQFRWLADNELSNPRVVYPWSAPGGAFLVPMESLISQPVPTTLTIYLQPTRLMNHEWQWLAAMACEAQSKGEQTLQQVGVAAGIRVVDPAAGLAGRLYFANLRRLSTGPFLVNVHCAAASSRHDAARSLAGAIQSLVQEAPFDQTHQDEERLPSAATVIGAESDDIDGSIREQMWHQYQDLRFNRPTRDEPLIRLPYLADARGAATVFRMPISVRGGVPGIEVRQLAPDFHPGPRVNQRPEGCLDLGRYQDGGRSYFPKNDLCKHALVTGFTGSGKTVTVLQLLHQLWVEHGVPFLVLESAKQEYRGLAGVPAFKEILRVYTLGNELCVPFRLNPFQLLPGVRVEAHLSKLQTCFEGAIPPIGPSASVISESLLRVYEEHGWLLTDVCPLDRAPSRRFPRMSEFVDMAEKVLQERGYEGEVLSNLKAALIGRFRPLLMGGKGRMFDTERSHPSPDLLFSVPTILELNDLNVDDKALVVMFLLTLLREYRERNRGPAGELLHVTMVEEAHNVLENVASKGSGEGATSADTRFKAVEAFCQLLTEVRALGEGLIIADQSPEKLARDAMRNTNLQIAHQLRDGHDREAIANAMIMEKEQQDFLGKLRPGQAALFRTGLEKATFIQVDQYYPPNHEAELAASMPLERARQIMAKYRGTGFDPLMTDEALRQQMAINDPASAELSRPILPYRACRFCQSQCRYRDTLYNAIAAPAVQTEAESWFSQSFESEAMLTAAELWSSLSVILRSALANAGIAPTVSDASWCALVHLWTQRYGNNPPVRVELDQDMYQSCLRYAAGTITPDGTASLQRSRPRV